jgi:hypothetical protein
VRFRRDPNDEAATSDTAVPAPPDPDDFAATAQPPGPEPTPEPPASETPLSVEAESDGFGERPEVFVGAAFVGGFALAQIMKRFGK